MLLFVFGAANPASDGGTTAVGSFYFHSRGATCYYNCQKKSPISSKTHKKIAYVRPFYCLKLTTP